MQYKKIPSPANFTFLNPKAEALEANHTAIPMTTSSWDCDFRVVCVNNYGAAGSNAAALVCQHPKISSRRHDLLSRYPLMILAHSSERLKAYGK